MIFKSLDMASVVFLPVSSARRISEHYEKVKAAQFKMSSMSLAQIGLSKVPSRY